MPLTGEKIRPNRIFLDVVEQIQKAILDGSLKPGEILPSEMKLKEMFAISRGTVREALRVLEQKGLIEIKVGAGGGATVKTVGNDQMVEILDLLVQSQKISFHHLTEFRKAVEGIVAGLAAERSTNTDIQHLQGIITEFRNLFQKDGAGWKDFARIDVKLHIAIADIVGNPLFKAVLQMIHQNILGTYERFSLKNKSIIKENYQNLCDIVEAIEKGRANDAKSLAQYHVQKFSGYMENANRGDKKEL